jgi:phosphoglycerate kinase
MALTRIENIEVKSKRVLVRVDFDVRIENGVILELSRIEKVVPTLELLSMKGARVIITTHLGNPKGKVDPHYSVKPLAMKLSEIMDKKIEFHGSMDINSWVTKSHSLADGEILFVENLFFFPEEESNEPSFAKKLSEVADIYVNDAFGLIHKKYASIISITEFLPSYAGTLMFRELEMFQSLISKPEKPFLAIFGGSRVSTKIKILNSLLPRATTILIGGAMAYTFLKSRAVPVGSSVVEKDYEVLSHQFIDRAGIDGVEVILPTDHIIADSFSQKARTKSVDKMGILDGWMGMDIGSKTISHYEKIIKNAGTIFWTGPMGVIEFDKFSNGTIQIANAIAKSNAKSIISGYETVEAVYKAGVENKITHLSTGGDACLELLEGKKLPGIIALQEKERD